MYNCHSMCDDCFQVGGHSLLAATLVGRLSGNLGLTVSVVDLYTNPTLDALIAFLQRKITGSTATVPAGVGPVSTGASQ